MFIFVSVCLKKYNKNKQYGFSLVELLVVVAILAILAAIAIPLFLNQKAKAKTATVQSDIHNLIVEGKTLQSSYATLPETQANLANAGLSSVKASSKVWIGLYPNCSLTNASTAVYTAGEFVIAGQTGSAYSAADGADFVYDSKTNTWYSDDSSSTTYAAIDAASPCNGVVKRWYSDSTNL